MFIFGTLCTSFHSVISSRDFQTLRGMGDFNPLLEIKKKIG